MLNPVFPIMPVYKMHGHQNTTKWTELVKPATGADFPAQTLVSVNGANEVQAYDLAIHNIAISTEAAKDPIVGAVKAGPYFYATEKDEVLLDLIGDAKLVMTASWTGGTPVIYDPATHENQPFEAAVDPATGLVFIDLTTVGAGPFTIRGLYQAPHTPDPLNTGLPNDKRYNARVIVEVDPAIVFAGF